MNVYLYSLFRNKLIKFKVYVIFNRIYVDKYPLSMFFRRVMNKPKYVLYFFNKSKKFKVTYLTKDRILSVQIQSKKNKMINFSTLKYMSKFLNLFIKELLYVTSIDVLVTNCLNQRLFQRSLIKCIPFVKRCIKSIL